MRPELLGHLRKEEEEEELNSNVGELSVPALAPAPSGDAKKRRARGGGK